MEINLDDYEFYIKPGATDLRERAISLARVVQDEMKLSPFEKAIFMFCNKSCRRITAILWDNNGWIEISKVLECRGTYCWPKDYEVAKQVKTEEIMSMLRGANIRELPDFETWTNWLSLLFLKCLLYFFIQNKNVVDGILFSLAKKGTYITHFFHFLRNADRFFSDKLKCFYS